MLTPQLTHKESQVFQLRKQGSSKKYVALNLAGRCIGSLEYARHLLGKYDIRPESIIPGEGPCSIGFSPRYQKWFGWSHRAIYGFGVGSKVKKGELGYVGATPEDLIEAHAEFFSDISAEHAEEARRECQILEDRSGIRILHAPLNIPVAGSIEEAVEALDDDADLGQLEQVDINEGFSIQKCGRGEWNAETLEDAKQMAIDFADSVA